ncbi:MAG: S1C family serine protease [Planctomycetaceae bacterium]
MRKKAVSRQRSAISGQPLATSQLCSAASPSPPRPLSPSPATGGLSNHLPTLLRALLSVALLFGTPQLQLKAAERVRAEDDVQAKVVKLFGAGGLAGLQGYGTGFVISPQGHIATVWSHLLDGDTVSVVLSNGKRAIGRVVATEAKLDLAVLKIEADDLDYFDLSKTATAGPGTRILAFSNMFKVAAGDEPLSVQHGIISARTQLSARRGRFASNYNGPVYVVDAITNNPGAAGGVLTTRDGQLLGMLGRELRDANSQVWVNYVIPIGELAPTLQSMVQGEYVRAPESADSQSNGRNIPPRTFGMLLVPDIVFRTPAYIDEVLPGSAAERAKLQPDDLIVFLNGKVVNSVRTLQVELNLLQPGQDAEFVIRRGSELITVKFPVPLNVGDEM